MPRRNKPEEARTRRITVALREQDFQELSEEAREGLTSVSTIANRRIRGNRRLPSPLDLEAVRHLSFIDNNLNQLVRKIHSGFRSELTFNDVQALRLFIESVRLKLLGVDTRP